MSSSSTGSYSGFDSLTAGPENTQTREDRRSNWRRRLITSYPKQVVRSLSLRSHKEEVSNPPASTTSAQLRAATVRGEISASEEQVNIARAQSERDVIRYHADEAVKAGNVAAVIKDDQAYWIEYDSNSSVLYAPPLKKNNMSAEGSSSSNQQPAALGSVNKTQIMSDNGSKKKMPWDAIDRWSTFPTRMNTKNQEVDKNNKTDDRLEEKVLQMKQQVLQESHNQSGALLLSEPATQLDCKARARVKLIIENPEKACAYFRMGLANNPGMDLSQMIEMIDYYCT